MLCRLLIALLVVVPFAGCSACTGGVPCSKNSDCAEGDVCAASTAGTFCVPEGAAEGEGEGEGEGEPNPSATLQLTAGAVEGDERLDVTLAWTLSDVSNCALEADGIATTVDVSAAPSAAYAVEQSESLQIVCDEASSNALAFVVHDVSELTGPTVALPGATITYTFTVEGVSVCTVTTNGVGAALTQPVIVDGAGSFTDTADDDKSYTLTCAGSAGPIVRTIDLVVLEVAEVTSPPAIITWGDDVALTVSVETAATCVLVSTTEDGSDPRSEATASETIDGEQRTFSLTAPTAVRAYAVECSIDDVTASSTPALVRIRPRILSFDGRIPGIETLIGNATLELVHSIAGIEAGGSCVVNDGAVDAVVTGASTVLTTGPDVAVYSLRCLAPGGDPSPNTAGGWQAIWRDTTEGDRTLLAASRFAMRNNVIDNRSLVDDIDLGLLEQVGGDLTFDSLTAATGGFTIAASSLRNVGANLTISNITYLNALLLPELRSASTIYLFELDSLDAVDLPELTSLSGDLGIYVGTCSQLSSIDLPSLVGRGNVLVDLSPVLQRVSAPALMEARTFGLLGCPALTTVEVPHLVMLSRYLQVIETGLTTIRLDELTAIGEGMEASSNPVLQLLDLPVLTTTGLGGFVVVDNPALDAISTPVYKTMDATASFHVVDNINLTCEVIEDAYCRMTSRDPTPTVTNNKAPTCPGVNNGC